MSSGKKTAPTVSVLAEHVSDHLSVFVVAEDTDAKRPANGGLRVLNYPSDEACIADGQRLAGLMTHKHDLYGTGFAGGKIVARAAEPDAVKDELISVTAELLESLDGAMITGCDLNTSLEDMERLTALTPHVLAAVGSPVTPVPPPPTAPSVLWRPFWTRTSTTPAPAGPSCTAAVPLVAPLPAISSSTVGPCSPWI
jgi:leucine dehydrogenase